MTITFVETPSVEVALTAPATVAVEVGIPTLPVVVAGSAAPGTYVAVGPTPPPSPALNALWVDTS